MVVVSFDSSVRRIGVIIMTDSTSAVTNVTAGILPKSGTKPFSNARSND